MPKILLVDDDHMVQMVVTRFLQKKGYEVLIASNGEEGIKMAFVHEPDLILMDLRLPILDGWQATRLLKEAPTTNHIPVMALTTQTLFADRQKCLAIGFDDFAAKPIQFEQLIRQIQTLLKTPILL